nr:MAG TPA: hypothetical protein [Herelleviridae sp.]
MIRLLPPKHRGLFILKTHSEAYAMEVVYVDSSN